MARILVRTRDPKEIEELRRHGKIVFLSSLVDLVGVETTEAGIEKIKKLFAQAFDPRQESGAVIPHAGICAGGTAREGSFYRDGKQTAVRANLCVRPGAVVGATHRGRPGAGGDKGKGRESRKTGSPPITDERHFFLVKGDFLLYI